MKIQHFDRQDEAQFASLINLLKECAAHDEPGNSPRCPVEMKFILNHEGAETDVAAFVALEDGQVRGAAIVLSPIEDNTHLSQFNVYVAPEYRRSGIGTSLFEFAAENSLATDRPAWMARTVNAIPGGPARASAGAAFAEAKGFTAALNLHRRRSNLHEADLEVEQALEDDLGDHVSDYELVEWVGTPPEDIIEGVAALTSLIMDQVPSGEVMVEEQKFNAERLRTVEDLDVQCGIKVVSTAARHKETGQIAAMSRAAVNAEPGTEAEIRITLVDPQHRGHRLGTLVKIGLHRQLRRDFPQVVHVKTGNADINPHMSAINDKLGYVEFEKAVIFQRVASH
ncbi:GNAT family N-acetyltransferase [Natronoglycomyces albus]|uniref:GNAT family N-acetyltransferase n=1 Tax=Natronoglycomyces albus TaxID=2811108 RepID=A0A895XQB9_9ACTN|nr:GNAT family N-acetyltransferase [Natronoglycomyces albus]QSB05335.1 GNAT family N-acetyltransferase [Natronoglycomyces albus]